MNKNQLKWDQGESKVQNGLINFLFDFDYVAT